MQENGEKESVRVIYIDQEKKKPALIIHFYLMAMTQEKLINTS